MAMALADRLRKLREDQGLSLDEVATKANISKTYLWELERDKDGVKKPSADVLLRIATALSTTLAEILSLATVQAPQGPVELPPSLRDFRDRMAAQSTPLSPNDLQELAAMKFRGAQPQTADQWHQLYLFLANTVRRKPS
ncbi:helix-turn-helix domain-containing protein [Anatilimnocola floriformis]|uniref:helix-turn-helix domain-containing protein n=1 Tax=Anatilimnocola floriformis TaxID=2948575 RepID=UPI0028F3EA23|nr:helix-turn-helix transcriptional regulator [Anatilimnocola floriformis]